MCKNAVAFPDGSWWVGVALAANLGEEEGKGR
jgi:hypothetical protein